jgi:hypothetical protein
MVDWSADTLSDLIANKAIMSRNAPPSPRRIAAD